MTLSLTKVQRVILVIAAASMVLIQSAAIADEGTRGIGWVLAFSVATILLLLAVTPKRTPQRDDKLRASDQGSLNDFNSLRSRAASAVSTTKVLADRFQQHCKEHGIRFTMSGMLIPTSEQIESLYLGYSVVAICFLDRPDNNQLFEFSAYKAMFIESLHTEYTQHFESENKSLMQLFNKTGDITKPDPTSMQPVIDSSIRQLLLRREAVARNCITNLLDAEPLPLSPLYLEIAPLFGGVADPYALDDRFGYVIKCLMKDARAAFS